MTVASFDEITADKPEKSLTERLMKKGGLAFLLLFPFVV